MSEGTHRKSRESDKMKKIGILILCIIFSFMSRVHALPHLKQIPEGGVLKVQFSQTRTLKGLPKPITSKGEFIIVNGKGVLWKTREPFHTLTLITKGGLFQIEGGCKSPLVQAGAEESIFEVVTKLINGKFQDIKGFDVKSLPSSQGRWKVRVTPLHAKMREFISFLDVEGNDFVSNITIQRGGGDTDKISFSDHHFLDASSLKESELRVFDD